MKLIQIVLILALFAACSSGGRVNESKPEDKKAVVQERDGLSYETAISFPSVEVSFSAVPLEKKWVEENYAGTKQSDKARVFRGGKSFDVITIENKVGDKKEIFFEVPYP